VGDPAHILVFCEDPVTGKSLRTHLASEGFKVTGAKTPLEAAWCLADGHVNLFLIHFPDAEWVVSAILMEVRRAHPTMPIVGLAPTISNELSQMLARIRISKVLPASTSWQGLAQTIHEALSSLEPATGGQA
jgi:DNA-binding NtrC family response regulator